MASRAGGIKDAGDAYPFSSSRGLASKGWTKKVGMSPRVYQSSLYRITLCSAASCAR